MGMLPAEKRIQIESIDDDLRNSLWNALTIFYWKTFKPRDRLGVISGSTLDRLFHALWWDYFKKPLDTIPRYYGDNNGGLGVLRKYFFDANGTRCMTSLSLYHCVIQEGQKNLDHCAINALSEKIQLIDSLMGELPKSPRPTRLRKSRTQCLIQFPMRVLSSIFTMLFRC